MSALRTVCLTFVLLIHGSAKQLRAQSIFADFGKILTESVLPGGYYAGAELRAFLRTNAWHNYRQHVSDTTAMNEIYQLAYASTGGNHKHALFASAMAVLEHRTIPIKLLFGIEIDLPLTLEAEANFERRVAELPEHIYSDSISDRDKLQHFFFSAYFNRILGMNWATYALGTLVEMGEDEFVIGGMDDPRDRHANTDGAHFGKLDEAKLPSECVTPNP